MEDPPRRKTATRSFRVDESALQTIEKDAAEANVSVNTLVNQLFISYADYYRYFPKFKGIVITSDEFSYLLQLLSDEAAAQAGKHTAQHIAKPVILAWYGALNLGTILEFFKVNSEHGRATTYLESEAGGKRTVMLLHDMGNKGSTYYAHFLATLLEMIDLKPKVTTTDNAVTVTL